MKGILKTWLYGFAVLSVISLAVVTIFSYPKVSAYIVLTILGIVVPYAMGELFNG